MGFAFRLIMWLKNQHNYKIFVERKFLISAVWFPFQVWEVDDLVGTSFIWDFPSISEVERTFMITSQFLNKETRAQKKADGFPSHSLANPRIGLFSFGSLVTQWCPTLWRPHWLKPARLLHPWDSPGKNTGVGCHFLLQCMKVRSESEVAQSWTAAYQASPLKKTRVCLLYCFVLSPLISLGAVPHHHLALSVKELTYSSNS